MDSDFMNNLANAMKNGNIPDDIKNMINNIKNNTSNSNTFNNNYNNDTNSNNFDNIASNTSNSINPDMLKNIMNMFNNSSSNFSNSDNTDTTNASTPNFDINMLLKMKSIMDKMNSGKNDPRSNLLLSLKPYLKESRKNKVEQYIQLFNMTKVIDSFNQDNGGENSK